MMNVRWEDFYTKYDFTESILFSVQWHMNLDFTMDLAYYWDLATPLVEAKVSDKEQFVRLRFANCVYLKLDIHVPDLTLIAGEGQGNRSPTIVGWDLVQLHDIESFGIKGTSEQHYWQVSFQVGSPAGITLLAKRAEVQVLSRDNS